MYTLTNGTGGTARHLRDGRTRDRGAIDPLVSQYAVVLAADHGALFAVDAGSDEVSSFRVGSDGALALAGTVSSGGDLPVSLAVSGNLVYALNTGSNTLRGFRVTGGASFGFDITASHQPVVSETQGTVSSYALGLGGALSPITASLSTSGRAACWVTITADGRFAYVTNAGTSTVAGFAIGAAGQLTALSPGTATGTPGTGAAPIDLDHVGSRFLYVLEAGTGTIGTFDIGATGALTARADTPAGAPASGLQGPSVDRERPPDRREHARARRRPPPRLA